MTVASGDPATSPPQDSTPIRTTSDRRTERAALVALVALYLVSACGFAIVTPYGEAPDEHAHLLYIEYLLNSGKLPDITPDPYSYESFQPPLYYLIDASIIAAQRILTGKKLDEPLAPPVLVKPTREPGVDLAVAIHPPEDRWPFTVYMLRGVSILMGLGLVLLTYATARVLVPWPAPATVPLLATAFAALIPQANFIRGSISNENLADLMGALIVWLLVLHIMRPYSERRIFWIGVALGLALLTRTSLIPLGVPVLWVLWVRHDGDRRRLMRDLAVIVGLVALLAGWLFLFRWVVYGDPLAFGATQIMIPPDNAFTLGELFWFKEPYRWMLWSSFWGVYGWQLIFMPGWIYQGFALVTGLAIAGGAYLLARRALSRAQQEGVALLLMTLLLIYAFIIRASVTYSVWQGREMYPALSSVCLLLGIGLGGLALGRGALQPLHLTRKRRIASSGMLVITSTALFALNVYSIIWVVFPALNSPNYASHITLAGPPPTSQEAGANLIVWDFRDCAPDAVSSWQVREARGSCEPGPRGGVIIRENKGDAQLFGPSVDIRPAASGARYMRIRASVRYPARVADAPFESKWYWKGPGEDWSKERRQRMDVKEDGVPHIYWTYVPATDAGEVVDGLRFDPSNGSAAAIQWIAVDLVK